MVTLVAGDSGYENTLQLKILRVCEGATTSTTMMLVIKAGDSLTDVQWSVLLLLYEQRDCEMGAFI